MSFDRLTDRGSTGSPTAVRQAHRPRFDKLNVPLVELLNCRVSVRLISRGSTDLTRLD